MSLPPELRSVVFYLFHTLVVPEDHLPEGFSYRQNVIDLLGCEPSAFLAFWDETYMERETTPIDLVDLVARFQDGEGREPLNTEQRRQLDRWFGVAKDEAIASPRPEVIELLRGLRPRVSIGVLSNCYERETRRWSQSPLAQLVDVTVRSCDIGAMKPDIGPYRQVLQRLDVEAEHTIYVGNGGSDELAGARNAGFASIIHMNAFDRQYRLVDDDEQRRRRDQADRSVDSVAELGRALAGLLESET